MQTTLWCQLPKFYQILTNNNKQQIFRAQFLSMQISIWMQAILYPLKKTHPSESKKLDLNNYLVYFTLQAPKQSILKKSFLQLLREIENDFNFFYARRGCGKQFLSQRSSL